MFCAWRVREREREMGMKREKREIGAFCSETNRNDGKPCSGAVDGFPSVQTSRRNEAWLICVILLSPFPPARSSSFSTFHFFPLLHLSSLHQIILLPLYIGFLIKMLMNTFK